MKVKGLGEETEVKDIEALKLAFAKLGGVWHEGRNNPKYYGRNVGDTRWPAWLTEEGMTQFDHVVSFPGCRYEVGIKKRGDTYAVVADHYEGALSRKVGGKQLTHLVDAYVKAKTQLDTTRKLIQVARNQGYGVTKKLLDDGTHEITINYQQS